MERLAVLVVEDELNVQETLAAVLTLEGFKAHRASSVDEALAILDHERVDAVSLDVRMPDPKGQGRDGLTLLKHLRSVPQYADIPVLLFTGVELKPDEQRLAGDCHATVFYKPQLYGTVINELNRLLAKRPPTPAA